MSMVINTNVQAIRTHNVYSRNNTEMNAAMTRVATGMKINSAKDGASTWAISEKMRERIRANDQANQNVQNDTALIKTAQGGIGNTIDILKTLKERAINAANDSNTNEDRARIAIEVEQLVKQINDNADKVKFNGRRLLDGTIANDNETTFTPEAEGGSTKETVSTGSAATMAEYNGASSGGNGATAAVYVSRINSGTPQAIQTSDFKEYLAGSGSANSSVAAPNNLNNALLVNLLDKDASGNNNAIDNSSKLFNVGDVVTLSFTLDGEKKENSYTVTASSTLQDLLNTGLDGNGVNSIFDGGNSQSVKDSSGTQIKATTMASGATEPTDGSDLNNLNSGVWALVGDKGKVLSDVQLTITGEDDAFARDKAITALFGSATGTFSSYKSVYKAEETAAPDQSLQFYIGGEQGFAVSFGINAMNSTGLKLGNETDFANMFLDKKALNTGDGTNSVIQMIDNALNKALDEQTKLGAWESRLGYTSDNITTMNENLEAADSVMRDSDVAKEMTTYMKYSVLAQASQYMLAQAGQNAFAVLNLLQA